MESNNSDKFDVAAAKEWWYGSFRKSDAFNRVNVSSPFYVMRRDIEGGFANALHKQYPLPQPSWKRGSVYRIGNLEIVDLPLVAANRVIPVPLKQSETTTDQQRIGSASITRLILVPKTDGNVAVRVVTVIPSLSYLKKYGYLLPFQELKDLPSDFEGILSVKAWDETEIVSWLYNGGGKRRIKVGLLTRPSNKINNLAVVPCPPIWGIVNQYDYCVAAGEASEDEPDPCDDRKKWVQVVEYGWIFPEGPCDDGSGNGDPCLNLTAEECACVTYGLGCDVGDGGGDGDGIDDNIIDSLKTPCLSNSLALVTGGNSINNVIGNMLQNMFGASPLINVRFRESYNLSNSVDGTADISGTSQRIDVLVRLNGNVLPFSSREYAVATILHESLHAINMASGVDALIRGDHIDLAVMVNEIRTSLMQIFPNLSYNDAEALAWGGIEGSGPIHYDRLTASQQQSIQAINSAHRNRVSSGSGT
ncbi:MAG TPA: hypothetical protein VFM18_16460, partial [Methanosarcina sp.]|nr:hypothetical protein [Methanosarcina sp.]